MYPKIKYLFLVICSGCMGCIGSSCSSDTYDPPQKGESVELSFEVSGISRASEAVLFDNFAVFGDIKIENSSIEPSVIFNKTEVINTGNGWVYQGTQYWFPNHEHSFVAIHPLLVLKDQNNPGYSGSTLTFTYNLPMSEENLLQTNEVEDIVVATHRRLYHENDEASPVSLNFAHLLSQINFSLELTAPTTRSEECYKIQKFEMTGFGTSSTINISPAQRLENPQTNDSKIDIVTAKGNGSLTVTFDQPIEVINGAAAVRMFDSNNAIIMLPQALEGNDNVQISLTYTSNDEAEENQVSANLSNFKWERGRSYNYNIKLEFEQKEVNMVISEATIDPWNLVDDHDEVDAR